jgi:hypothetical protein
MKQMSDTPATVTLFKPRHMRGYLAAFDVLGFKSFCLNNTDEEAADSVLRIIDLVPEAMPGFLCHLLARSDKAQDAARKYISRIRWSVFSDTIVAAMQVDDKTTNNDVTIYLSACSFLNRIMFERGLPLRGAICYGSFVMRNRCIAGRTLVESLDKANGLEAACTVLSDEVWASLEDRFAEKTVMNGIMRDIVRRRRVPIKKPGTVNMSVLNWLCCNATGGSNLTGSLDEVLNAFLAHGKEVNESVMVKVRNTAELFRSCLPKAKKSEQSGDDGGSTSAEQV